MRREWVSTQGDPECRGVIWFRSFLLIFLFVVPNWCCGSTFSTYSSRSPNRALLMEAAVERVNLEGYRIRTLALHDVKSNRLVWKRTASHEESYCWAVYVSNSGRAVLSRAHCSLLILDPFGNNTGEVNLIECAFSSEERKQYVKMGHHHNSWSGFSLWYPVEFEEKDLFIIRPWWGRRVVIDLASASVLDHVPQGLDKALEQRERAWVLRSLSDGVQRVHFIGKSADGGQVDFMSTIVAAYIAGRIPVLEAVPSLRLLERETSGSWGSSTWLEFVLPRVAHLSLRRLGQRPILRVAGQEQIRTYEGLGKVYPSVPEREERVSRVKEGQLPDEVGEAIGAPDFIDEGYSGDWKSGMVWYYDMDTENPYTLKLYLSKSGLSFLQYIRPPLWQTSEWDRRLIGGEPQSID